MKKKRFIILLAFLGGVFTSVVPAAEKPLAPKKLTQALVEDISGEGAWNYTDMISRFDRVQASEGWHDAAVAIQKELEKIGYKDIALEGWPSDGTKRYYTFRSVICWRAKKGELWLLSPTRERLCSYDEIPLSLVKHSHSANVEAELVDVGPGVGEECYRNKDVKGKIVLTYGYPQAVVREAVMKRGALGLVTWYPPDVRPGYPNLIRYTAIWPRWEDRERVGFGFNVSKYQGAVLKRQLEEGKKVILKADVETEFYQGNIETLSAVFPGSVEPESELMIIGHLCHPTPSANDNGSGSGGMLEMARALKKMVEKGLIDPPRRTIRFLWVPEFNGTVPYIQAHLARTKKTLAVINCDMIGEDFHKTGGLFRIFCTPDSNPSFLNDVVANFASLVESLNLKSINGSSHPFVYKVSPYSGGSDHVVFNDGALKVPSVMLNHGDTFHHTSLDTMDKVDSSELRRICAIALGSIYYLANASDSEAKDMARLIARNGIGRFSEDYYDAVAQLDGAQSSAVLQAAYAQVLNVIKHSSQRETQALYSTLAFSRDKVTEREIKSNAAGIANLNSLFIADVQRSYESLCRKMGTKPGPVVLTAEEKMLGRIVPVRVEDFVCPLDSDYLLEKLGEEALQDINLFEDSSYEALNFVDGQRSVLEIAKAVSAEYGPLDAQNVLAFFKVLEKAGLVSLKQVR
jgi:hypothetical protein